MRGKRSEAGKFKQNREERKLRRRTREDLAEIVKGADPEAPVTTRIRNDYKD
jgi:hypothetical protein